MTLGPLRPTTGQGWDGGRYVDFATMAERVRVTVTESGGSYPGRPSGFDFVEFVGDSDPGVLAHDGDIWVVPE